ncbi:hypothetical protein EVAR_94052_1 [Eumeta japonica]|uniref:Uncharacterized protein n=1 Tax=Eumeta variegata TaxID=151549 RepID=A0A4C1V5Z0_EUMVA|nr:hypothetical protein EVAR_94052_1 [Eumeta japonica]
MHHNFEPIKWSRAFKRRGTSTLLNCQWQGVITTRAPEWGNMGYINQVISPSPLGRGLINGINLAGRRAPTPDVMRSNTRITLSAPPGNE